MHMSFNIMPNMLGGMNGMNGMNGMSGMMGMGMGMPQTGLNLNLNIGMQFPMNFSDSLNLSGGMNEQLGQNPLSSLMSQLSPSMGSNAGMGMVPGFGGATNQMGSMFGGMMQMLQQQQMMMMQMMMMMMMQMMQSGFGGGGGAMGSNGMPALGGTGTGADGASGANGSAPAQSSGKSNANKASAPYEEAINKAAQKYNLDPNLIRAVIQTESSFRPNAVSKCGAQGLMQLMPGTARGLGVSDSFDPSQNIDGGAKYIRQMLDRFNGNLDLALAAYNQGPGAVSKNGLTAGGKKYADKVKSYMN